MSKVLLIAKKLYSNRIVRYTECIIIMLVSIIILLLLFFANSFKAGFLPPCAFYSATGYFCPGCGLTRAAHQLLHGNILRAIDFNPLAVIIFPLLAFFYILYLKYRIIGGRLFPEIYIRPLWIWIFIIVIFAFWIFRNVPMYPFTLLAP